ncbi:hypothetical protein NDA10_006034 [Ustilago hordei]|nr:hypothetical protein NDA10_006034 [Ustilago hordei]
MYKETVATVSQLSFSTLATTLSIWQSAIKNNPASRVDPHQASARVAGSDDQNETPRDDEKDEKDADSTSTRSLPDPEGFDVGSAKDLDMGSVNAMHQ